MPIYRSQKPSLFLSLESSIKLPQWALYVGLISGFIFLVSMVNKLLPLIAFSIILSFLWRQAGKFM